MATAARADVIARATALMKEAAENINTAKELMLSVETSGNYSRILGAIHERAETEAIILRRWLDNETHDLVVQQIKSGKLYG